MSARRCDRCNATGTDDHPIRSITICLDGNTSAGQLCRKHGDIARADVGTHQWFLAGVRGHDRAHNDAAVPEPAVTVPDDLPPRHRVPVGRVRRVEHFPDDEPAVTPYLPPGLNLNRLRQAVQTWQLPPGVRATAKKDDIDPDDIYLAADGDGEEYPNAKDDTVIKVGPGFTLLLDTKQFIILNVRPQRKQGQ